MRARTLKHTSAGRQNLQVGFSGCHTVPSSSQQLLAERHAAHTQQCWVQILLLCGQLQLSFLSNTLLYLHSCGSPCQAAMADTSERPRILRFPTPELLSTASAARLMLVWTMPPALRRPTSRCWRLQGTMRSWRQAIVVEPKCCLSTLRCGSSQVTAPPSGHAAIVAEAPGSLLHGCCSIHEAGNCIGIGMAVAFFTWELRMQPWRLTK